MALRWVHLRRPPVSVIAYAVIVLALVIALVDPDREPRSVPAAVLLLGAVMGLLVGLWPAWLFLTLIEVGNLLMLVGERPDWLSWKWMLLKAAMVALLIIPATRGHVAWPRFLRRLDPA